MEHDYQLMDTDERLRHHDVLRDEGFEWCPECGTVLIWDLPRRSSKTCRSSNVPVVTGEYPPLTRDQLLMTVP